MPYRILASGADLFLSCHHAFFHDFFVMYSARQNINALERVRPASVQLDTGAAVTKPPPVIPLQVEVSHSHVTSRLRQSYFTLCKKLHSLSKLCKGDFVVGDIKLQRSPLQNFNFTVTLSVGFVLTVRMREIVTLRRLLKIPCASLQIGQLDRSLPITAQTTRPGGIRIIFPYFSSKKM